MGVPVFLPVFLFPVFLSMIIDSWWGYLIQAHPRTERKPGKLNFSKSLG